MYIIAGEESLGLWERIHEQLFETTRKDTVVAEADLLVALVIKLDAVEADVVWVSPGR